MWTWGDALRLALEKHGPVDKTALGGLEKHGPVDKTPWQARSNCSKSMVLSTKRPGWGDWPPESPLRALAGSIWLPCALLGALAGSIWLPCALLGALPGSIWLQQHGHAQQNALAGSKSRALGSKTP